MYERKDIPSLDRPGRQECPHCGTMLAKPDSDGDWAQESDGEWHDPWRCINVLHAQLTAERAKVEEATKALESVASCDENVCECSAIAFAALEKLRGQ